jgi:dipeptidyl aminopeptidase/acylaminoacyl peptidase
LIAAGGAAAMVGRASLAGAQAAPHALADFFRPSVTRDAALSPTGDRIAVLTETGEDEGRRAVVQIIDAAEPSKVVKQLTVGAGAIEVEWVEWVNDDRLLVVFTREIGGRTRNATGTHIGGGRTFDYKIRRAAAIGADGSNPVVMFENKGSILRSNYDLAGVVDTLPDDPANILMVAANPHTGVLALHRVDVNTGGATLVENGGPGTFDYHIHKGVPVLRFDAERGGSVHAIRARAPGEREWKYVRRTRRDQSPDFFVVSGTDRPDVLIVGARADGEDLVSLREMNVRTLAFGPPLSQRQGRDAVGAVLDERGRLIAAKYYEHRAAYDFQDKGLAPHFKAMDRFFDNEANIHLFDVDDSHTRFLAKVTGSREPGAYFLYDKAAKRLETLGSAHPGLDPARLGKRRRCGSRRATARNSTPISRLRLRPGPARWSCLPTAGRRSATTWNGTGRCRSWPPRGGGCCSPTSAARAAMGAPSPRRAGSGGASACRRTWRTRSPTPSAPRGWRAARSPSWERATAATRR